MNEMNESKTAYCVVNAIDGSEITAQTTNVCELINDILVIINADSDVNSTTFFDKYRIISFEPIEEN